MGLMALDAVHLALHGVQRAILPHVTTALGTAHDGMGGSEDPEAVQRWIHVTRVVLRDDPAMLLLAGANRSFRERNWTS